MITSSTDNDKVNLCEMCNDGITRAVIPTTDEAREMGGHPQNVLTLLCDEHYELYCLANESEEEREGQIHCHKCRKLLGGICENYNLIMVNTLLGPRFEYECDSCRYPLSPSDAKRMIDIQ
jgi:hypothetical protein